MSVEYHDHDDADRERRFSHSHSYFDSTAVEHVRGPMHAHPMLHSLDCEECEGTGWSLSPIRDEIRPCWKCGGTGAKP